MSKAQVKMVLFYSMVNQNLVNQQPYLGMKLKYKVGFYNLLLINYLSKRDQQEIYKVLIREFKYSYQYLMCT